jgi:hypothetical protein
MSFSISLETLSARELLADAYDEYPEVNLQTENENEVSDRKLKDGSTAGNIEPLGVDLENGKQARLSSQKAKQERGIMSPYITPGELDSIVVKKPQNKASNMSKYSDLESMDIDPRSMMKQFKGEAP